MVHITTTNRARRLRGPAFEWPVLISGKTGCPSPRKALRRPSGSPAL